jgi:hypothetical protein
MILQNRGILSAESIGWEPRLMPYPAMADVKAILEPFHPRIRKVIELAWAEFRAVVELRAANGIGPLLYSRTVANDVFDAIARYAIAEFAADPSVHIEIEAQTIKLFFKGGVCARFKKGDDNKLGQNHPTQASMNFEDADAQVSWFPVETAKVEFIWLPNSINTKLEEVLVVARDGDKLLWDYPIETAAEGGATIIPFPEPPPPAPPSDDDDLVKPKLPEVKKPRENDE